jgi:hypothetical protein
MSANTKRRLFLVASFLLALASFLAPFRGRPLDYYGLMYKSVPLSCLWLIVVVVGIVRLRRQSLWMLLGLPFALIGPITLLLSLPVPSCYQLGGCQ